jgi:hypothetical protein
MKQIRSIHIGGLLGLALACAGVAAAAEGPTVDSVLEKYVTASGGKAALEKISSRVMKLKIESEAFGASDGQIYSQAPNKMLSHIELANSGSIDEGFDGTVAWAKSPWQALRVKSGDELAKARRDGDFHRIMKFKTVYPDLTFKGTEKVGTEEAYVLESKPSATSKEKFWFSVKTGLPLRQESEYEGQQGQVTSTALVQSYKTVEGVKYPEQLKISVSAGGQSFEFTMKFVEIEHNPKIDPAKFTKPSA